MDNLLYIGLTNAGTAVLLALLAFAASRTIRRPALSHCFWLLVLLKLVTPPLVRIPLPEWPGPANAPVAFTSEARAMEMPPSPAPPHAVHGPTTGSELAPPDVVPAKAFLAPSISWPALVLGVWATGSCAWWSVAAIRVRRFGRLLKQGKTASDDVRDRVRRLAGLLELRRVPNVSFLAVPVSPLLWAVGLTPRLVLPTPLWDRLDDGQRDSLLVHELAHLRRRDHLVRWLEMVALGLYWWLPVAWWARRELQDAEEECCDGWVAHVLRDSGHAYASALIETVEFVSVGGKAVQLGASNGGHARQVKRRVTMILEGKTARPLRRPTALAVIALGAGLLVLAPGTAEPPPARPAESVAPEQAPDKVQGPPVAARADDAPRAGQRQDSPAGDLRVKFEAAVQQLEEARKALADNQAKGGAHEEIERLEVQLRIKQKRLDVAELEAAGKRQLLQTAEQSNKSVPGSVSREDVNKIRNELLTAEAEAMARKAELAEPEVLLKQARRRLEAEEMGEKINRLQKEVESLEKNVRREEEWLERGQRARRWRVNFDTTNADKFLRQLRDLRVHVGFPKGDGKGLGYRFIRDLSPGQPVRRFRDVDLSINNLPYWTIDRPEEVRSLAHALGLPDVPHHFLLLIPDELCKKLVAEERGFRGREVQEILETKFDLRMVEDKYVPVPVQQKSRE